MTLLDELYDLKADEPIQITLEKLLKAEFDLDRKIKALSGEDDSSSLSAYLRRKRMLTNLKFEFASLS